MTSCSVGAVAVILLGALVAGCGGQRAVTPTSPGTEASTSSFLAGYVDPDGRVVRRDQGGDTVSEGQAYAMLLDVATGNRTQFARVWGWSESHIEQPDGLLAYHWDNGKVVDKNAASDADLDVARALLLAGFRWNDKTWETEGSRYAKAILDDETVSVAGKLWLVAGPWDRSDPYYLDPSYLDPATFELLARTTHDSRWPEIARSSAAVISSDTGDGTRLPSDWAMLHASGQLQPSGPPGGGAIRYSYDAFRTLIRQDDDCQDGPGREIDADLLGLAAKTAASDNQAQSYHLDGTAAEPGDNPLLLVGAAGAAHAAGDVHAADAYLNRALLAERHQPSYFLAAWVELGHYLLTTSTLTGCQS